MIIKYVATATFGFLFCLTINAAEVRETGFVSSSGATRLAVTTDYTRGRYTTRVNGQPVYGIFTVEQVNSTNELTTLSGDFIDYNGSNVCTGFIDLIIRKNTQGNFYTEVQWEVRSSTDYPDCSDAPGTVFRMQLTEALPSSDRSGNFTSMNSNTLPSESAGKVTWPLWRVVDSDGLNCRLGDSPIEPNAMGDVYTVIEPSELVEVSYPRSPNAIFKDTTYDTTYLRISRHDAYCWVRANTRYIEPVSVLSNTFFVQ